MKTEDIMHGGAIGRGDGAGLVHYEENEAYSGGAIWLQGTSKLVLKPRLNVSFISNNYAQWSGGALFIKDSQCSLRSTARIPVECFITIDGPLVSISSISFHFVNNSAGITGGILFGGQLDTCRLCFRNRTEQSGLCVCNDHDYNDNAFALKL